MARTLTSIAPKRHHHNQVPPPARSAPPPKPVSQFKAPSNHHTAANSGGRANHPGVRGNNLTGKSHPRTAPAAASYTNNKIINEVKPNIQSGPAPSPTAMLSRSISGRFQPRAAAPPPPSSSSSSEGGSDGMISRGTFVPSPAASSTMYGCYPSGCPGSRMF
jgi:hypothetical protein